jgi:glucose/arabinose dehydrogenase/head-tail adaptor
VDRLTHGIRTVARVWPDRSARRIVAWWTLLMLAGVLSIPAARTRAATFPISGFSESQVAGSLLNPTAMAIAPDGRIFVALQSGELRVIKNDQMLATPFLRVTTDAQAERGLLGVTFDPNFPTEPYVYIYYTATSPVLRNVVSRFTASGDVAVAGSERRIFELDALRADRKTHNGGALHFGTDGKLYIAVGDNVNPRGNAQDTTNLYGKLLRINKDGSIPTDNPFYNDSRFTGDRRAIWAMGLRNPFTFAIQPNSSPQRMFINDVGELTWEEINQGVAGANYGWPSTEGDFTDPALTAQYQRPFYAYPHASGTAGGCSITGGAFYNPATAQFPASYTGLYFFADYCNGWIKTIDPVTRQVSVFATGILNPVDLRVSPDGSLYYLSRGNSGVGNGKVIKVRYGTNLAPQITLQPQNTTVAIGQRATFNVSASGNPTYQWQRNTGGTWADISGATSATYMTPPATSSDNGARFRVRLRNNNGAVTSAEATLTVATSQPPVATISAPPPNSTYAGNQVFTYAGGAVDSQGQPLAPQQLTWWIDFHHDDHTHPFIPRTSGVAGGSFTIPTDGETSANVWYRIYLEARDSLGLTHTVFRDIHPRTVVLTIQTMPAGLQVTLDEQPKTAPVTTRSVVGVSRSIGGITSQTKDGVTYYFSHWSDSYEPNRVVATPAQDTSYLAMFARYRLMLPLANRN